VRKSLSKLSKAGLIVTTRGKNGASGLTRSPEKITLLDIYRASGAPATFAIQWLSGGENADQYQYQGMPVIGPKKTQEASRILLMEIRWPM